MLTTIRTTAFASLLFTCASVVNAGEISGSVTGSNGQVLHPAMISATDTVTGAVYSAVTETNGSWYIENVPDNSTFTLKAVAAGHKATVRVNVEAGRNDLNLQLAANQ